MITSQMRELKEAYAAVKKAAAEYGRASPQYAAAIKVQSDLVVKSIRERQRRAA